MEHGTPVRLRRGGWTGRIAGRVLNGIAYVKFDGGGAGNFGVSELEPIEDKQWPPATEHKAAP